MKLEQDNTEKMEIVIQKEVKKELKLIGSQRKISGLTLWQFNEKNKELTKATFKESSYVIGGGVKLRVITEENCIYFQALNRKNALKKIKKQNHER